jgi:hypothetical protein
MIVGADHSPVVATMQNLMIDFYAQLFGRSLVNRRLDVFSVRGLACVVR